MKKQIELTKDYLSNLETDIDLLYLLDHIDLEDITFDKLTDEIDNEGLFDQEVIYYRVAMDYLCEYDPSLHESLEIANNYGYATEDLSSELLASLLKTEKTREDWFNKKEYIDSFLNDIK